MIQDYEKLEELKNQILYKGLHELNVGIRVIEDLINVLEVKGNSTVRKILSEIRH